MKRLIAIIWIIIVTIWAIMSFLGRTNFGIGIAQSLLVLVLIIEATADNSGSHQTARSDKKE